MTVCSTYDDPEYLLEDDFMGHHAGKKKSP